MAKGPLSIVRHMYNTDGTGVYDVTVLVPQRELESRRLRVSSEQELRRFLLQRLRLTPADADNILHRLSQQDRLQMPQHEVEENDLRPLDAAA